MRKSTLFFVWTVSLLMDLCLTCTACGSRSLPSSTGTAPTPTRQPVNQVYALAWSPDGTTLATGGKNGAIQLWDTRSQTLLLSANDPSIYVLFDTGTTLTHQLYNKE